VDNGQELWFYSCSGPTRQFDPSYYRYQPWYGFRYGATGSAFWAFGDGGGADSWNEYSVIGYTSYTPLYVGEATVDSSKHWEAALEGVQDYEYLHMLSELNAELQQSQSDSARQRRAERLLDTLPAQLLERLEARQRAAAEGTAQRGSESLLAEQARRQILRLLVNGGD
ncbi:MAG: hypothetical protein WD118_03585, partial [Phycisphaeraceae bacterium]